MKTATTRGASTRNRAQASNAEQVEHADQPVNTDQPEPRVTFDIRDRNDVDGRGESYRIYQVEGETTFHVDKTSGGEIVHNTFGTIVDALECVGRHRGARAPEVL